MLACVLGQIVSFFVNKANKDWSWLKFNLVLIFKTSGNLQISHLHQHCVSVLMHSQGWFCQTGWRLTSSVGLCSRLHCVPTGNSFLRCTAEARRRLESCSGRTARSWRLLLFFFCCLFVQLPLDSVNICNGCKIYVSEVPVNVNKINSF